jgi:antirestriction protein ArdC
MKVVEVVLDRIIKGLKSGNNWLRTWATSLPCNGATGREYSGINKLMLWGAKNNRFYTWNQIKERGESVKVGAKAHPVIFWRILDANTDKEYSEFESRHIPLMRYYNVFNEADTTIKPVERITITGDAVCESIVENYVDKPPIEFGEPAYSPALDKVYMPNISDFSTSQAFYATLFHELSHSTGHKSRLDRQLKSSYGDNDYAQEELVAELSSAFLSAKSGIENKVKDNSQAYINGWIARFEEKPNLIISLASKAEKSYQYILGGVENE